MEKALALLAVAAILFLAAEMGHGPAPTDTAAGGTPLGTGVAGSTSEAVSESSGLSADAGRVYDYALGIYVSREDLPWFLRRFNQFPPGSDPLKTAMEVWRAIEWTRERFSGYAVVFGPGSVLEAEVEVRGRKIRVPFTEYVLRDGIVYHSSKLGPMPLYETHPLWPKVEALWTKGQMDSEEYERAKRLVSQAEFKKVVKFVERVLNRAVDQLDADILEVTRQLRAAKEEEFGEGILERELPWDIDPPLTVAEVFGLELYPAEEYVPPVVYVGPIRAWGFCISAPNIPVDGAKPERRIALHPQALVVDWITGGVYTTLHELVHTWQSFPLGWWYAVELFNEIYSTGMAAYSLDFLYHPYLERLRKIALRYFNFDADYAKDVVWAFKVGGVTEANVERFREMHRRVQEIYAELRKVTPEVYRRFYADPLYFITISDFLKDDAVFLDIIFASLYLPTCMGSPEDSPQEAALKTQRWVREHMQEIQDVWERTMKRMREQQRKREEDEDGDRIPSSILALAWWQRLPVGVREELYRRWLDGGMEACLEYLLQGGDL